MTEEIKTITYYKGKPITELSRDELIEALTFASKEIERLFKQNEHDRKFMFDVIMQKDTQRREIK